MNCPKSDNWLFFTFTFFGLLITRLPGWLTDVPLNVDESLVLAAEITKRYYGWFPWVHTDTTTIGPITSAIVTLMLSPFDVLDYAKLHLAAAVLWSLIGTITISLTYIASGRQSAIFCFFLLLLLSLNALVPDYLQFSSGLVPAFLISLAVWLYALSLKVTIPPIQYGLLFACGGTLYLSILAKLQVAPVAVAILIVLVLIAEKTSAGIWALRLWPASGFITAFVVTGFWLHIHGVLELSFISYIAGGISYGIQDPENSWYDRVLARIYSAANAWWMLKPAMYMLLLALGIHIFTKKPPPKNTPPYLWISLSWFISSLFVVLLPAMRPNHHGILLLAPTVFLLSILIARSTEKKIWQVLIFLLTVLFASPQLIGSYYYWSRSWPSWYFAKNRIADAHDILIFSELVDAVEQLSLPHEPLAIWGWAPEVFVYTNRPSASRHIISHFLIDKNLAKETHRSTFIHDLIARKPKLIIDATAPGLFSWTWGQEEPQSIQHFPEFQKFLKQNYSLGYKGSTGARIYLKRQQNTKNNELPTLAN
jgi:hypothetical protein